ncbi:hypothetical protein ROZALSC1DRAFT_27679 [Rozella allomycis CSF55]|uniref:HMG box domain-containing protein n=1 Tax=Rozella allomycis (strain CSF55) TaxID=988480 RepID=A0A075AW85_ROZAC|nr:hypothetical protein O9G_000874 [Rozella allomycis CSF55]RKP20866.1 hypothetical protein ROZALSC1DRAFT_27679 [Rozella allomycis CSF55]|eukprot:EPZ32799.1 hypothetical protein O9G_000874 [Rozella allomycis CSF55]
MFSFARSPILSKKYTINYFGYPQRSTSAVNFFIKDFFEEAKTKQSEEKVSPQELLKLAHATWKTMNAEEKKEKREHDMEQYKIRCEETSNAKKASFIFNMLVKNAKVSPEDAKLAVKYGKELPVPPKSNLHSYTFSMHKKFVFEPKNFAEVSKMISGKKEEFAGEYAKSISDYQHAMEEHLKTNE